MWWFSVEWDAWAWIAWWKRLHITPILTFPEIYCKPLPIVVAVVLCTWSNWTVPLGVGAPLGEIYFGLLSKFFSMDGSFCRLESHLWYFIMSAEGFQSCAFSSCLLQNSWFLRCLFVISWVLWVFFLARY